MGPNARASSTTPAAAVPGFLSPVHVVADPGITDSWAMSRVLLSACCSASQIATSALPSRAPAPTAQAQEDERHTQKLGSLRISPTSGRSPPTRPRDWGGGSSCGRAGAGFPGTSPPAWDLAPVLLSLGDRAGGSLRVILGLSAARVPASARRNTSASPTPALWNTPQRSTYFSANTLGLTVSPACFQGQLEPGFLSDSFILKPF